MAEAEEYTRFCEYAATQEASACVPSPGATDSASADAARRHGRDPEAAAGVSGIITQLLMLPTAAEASNLSAAYAAVLEQACLVHRDLTGDMGPTLEPASPAQGQLAAGGGGVAAWVLGGAGHGAAGMPVPPVDAAAHAPAAHLSAMGHGTPRLPRWLCRRCWVVLPPLRPNPPAMRPASGRPPGAWSGRVLCRFIPPLALAGRSASALRGVRPRLPRPLLPPQRRPRPRPLPAPMTICRMLSPMPMPGSPPPRSRRVPGAGTPLVSCHPALHHRRPRPCS